MARSPAQRSWILIALSLAGLGACIIANFQLSSWSMRGITGGAGQIGPFMVSDIAAAVITAVMVAMSVFLVEFSGRNPVFSVITALPKAKKLSAAIITALLLLGNAAAQAGTVYVMRLDQHIRSASGTEPMATESVVFGFVILASDPMPFGLAILFPMLMLGFSFTLMRQLSGVIGPATGATSDREGMVTRA